MGKTDQKPKRLYFKTYIQLIENAVGTAMFKNFYVQLADGTDIDAMDNGSDSCAFFVSSVLVLFKKVAGVHGTVANTLTDMQQSGWHAVAEKDMEPGDVVVWVPTPDSDGKQHIGFCIGDHMAISTSSKKQVVAKHDIRFGKEDRPIQQVLRQDHWDEQTT